MKDFPWKENTLGSSSCWVLARGYKLYVKRQKIKNKKKPQPLIFPLEAQQGRNCIGALYDITIGLSQDFQDISRKHQPTNQIGVFGTRDYS